MSATGPLVYISVQNRGCGYLSEIRTALMRTQTSISLQTPLIFKNKDHDLHVSLSHIMIGIMKLHVRPANTQIAQAFCQSGVHSILFSLTPAN